MKDEVIFNLNNNRRKRDCIPAGLNSTETSKQHQKIKYYHQTKNKTNLYPRETNKKQVKENVESLTNAYNDVIKIHLSAIISDWNICLYNSTNPFVNPEQQ